MQGLLDLYEASFDAKYLQIAVELTTKMRELFEDTEAGAFFSTAIGDTSLVMRIKEDYDGAEPSGNSIATLNMLRLAHTMGDEQLRVSADKTFSAFASKMADGPTSMPQMLVAFLRLVSAPQQIVFAGDDVSPLLDALRTRFLPNHTLLKAGDVPASANMTPIEGKAAAYVCENFTCQLPVTDPGRILPQG